MLVAAVGVTILLVALRDQRGLAGLAAVGMVVELILIQPVLVEMVRRILAVAVVAV
jgi:energy-converting hydrogenase Eha subunit E